MAITTQLTSANKLGTLLHLDLAGNDQYAALIISAASNRVRDEARQPRWVTKGETGDTLETGDIEAPVGAQDITLWLAMRAYTNPRNLSRRTAGPISESYFENGVYGLELTDDEKGRLGGMRDSGGVGGLWVQPLTSGKRREPVLIPSDLSPAGDSFHIADSDQWPYNLP